MRDTRPDWSALAVVICFAALLLVLLIRESVSAGEQYTARRAFKGHAMAAATELLRIDPDNETARAVIAAVERDVDPMEER